MSTPKSARIGRLQPRSEVYGHQAGAAKVAGHQPPLHDTGLRRAQSVQLLTRIGHPLPEFIASAQQQVLAVYLLYLLPRCRATIFNVQAWQATCLLASWNKCCRAIWRPSTNSRCREALGRCPSNSGQCRSNWTCSSSRVRKTPFRQACCCR